MDLDELRSVRRTERQKDSLQHLRDSFYEDVAAFIAERKAERRRAADTADDPFADPDVGRLTDEIETAEDVVESIYERRVGKVVKLASFAAADMSADTGGLTAEERELFDSLVGQIKQNRQAVLDVLSGEGGDDATAHDAPTHDVTPDPVNESSPTAAAEASAATDAASADAASADATPTPTGAADDSDDVLADAMGGSDTSGSVSDAEGTPSTGSPSNATAESDASESDPAVPADVPPDAPPDASPSDPAVVGAEDAPVVDSEDPPVVGADDASDAQRAPDETDRVTLRITEDVGQIFGVDEREYDLESEDVVTLPTTNAGPLLDRDAAEKLD